MTSTGSSSWSRSPRTTSAGRGRCSSARRRRINAEHLVDIVERSMSSPVYELLKRPDELFVVEHAHLQPRFVEDSVRHALAATLEQHPDLPTTTSSRPASSTSRRSTGTTWSRSARGRSGSCAASCRAQSPPGTPSCATGSALLEARGDRQRVVGRRRTGRAHALAAAAPAGELPAFRRNRLQGKEATGVERLRAGG